MAGEEFFDAEKGVTITPIEWEPTRFCEMTILLSFLIRKNNAV